MPEQIILHTTYITFEVPKNIDQPKAYRIEVGRSPGVYFTNFVLGSSTITPGVVDRINPFHFLDAAVTGIYFVKISAIHNDGTEVAAPEFDIDVVLPTDPVVAPTIKFKP